MITIKKEKPKKKKQDPYYLLKYNYMIGDANGNTSEEVELSVNNPFIERYVTLLNKLRPTKSSWGVILDEEHLGYCFDEKQITEDDLNFLKRMMFEDYCDPEEDEVIFPVSKEDEDYADEFAGGVRAETEYSFLVFEGCKLSYYDEFGVKHKTEFK